MPHLLDTLEFVLIIPTSYYSEGHQLRGVVQEGQGAGVTGTGIVHGARPEGGRGHCIRGIYCMSF